MIAVCAVVAVVVRGGLVGDAEHGRHHYQIDVVGEMASGAPVQASMDVVFMGQRPHTLELPVASV